MGCSSWTASWVRESAGERKSADEGRCAGQSDEQGKGSGQSQAAGRQGGSGGRRWCTWWCNVGSIMQGQASCRAGHQCWNQFSSTRVCGRRLPPSQAQGPHFSGCATLTLESCTLQDAATGFESQTTATSSRSSTLERGSWQSGRPELAGAKGTKTHSERAGKQAPLEPMRTLYTASSYNWYLVTSFSNVS